MSIKNYIPSEALNDVAEANFLNVSKQILDAIRKRRAEIDRERNSKPCIDDNDFRRDIKYKMGQIEAFDWILNMPEEAKKHLT